MNLRYLRRGWGLIAIVLLAACADKAVDPPAELVDIKPTLKVSRLWSEGLGGDAEHLRLGLQPVVYEGVVYAASHDGEVLALTADKGKRLWRSKTRAPLSGGPAVGAGLVVIGSGKGEVVALDSSTGKEKWRRQLSGEILAHAAIGQDVVVVRTVDGKLTALNNQDGAVRWSNDQPVPSLTLRGTAAPVLLDNLVLCGFDNGKLLAVELSTGDTLWNTAVGAPAGRTELDKLADIDSVAVVSGRDVFIAGYQGRVAMLDLDNGQIWWSKEASSYRGVALDEQTLFMTRADGTVTAMRRTDGAINWEQGSLHQRSLTAPTPSGDSVVVGDFEGYVHWLSKVDGAVQARVKTDGDRITNAPIAADGRIFVQTDKGKLLAFQTKPKG